MAYRLLRVSRVGGNAYYELRHNWPNDHVLTQMTFNMTYDIGTTATLRALFGYFNETGGFVNLFTVNGPSSSRRGNLSITVSGSNLTTVNDLINSGQVTHISFTNTMNQWIVEPSVSHQIAPSHSVPNWSALWDGVETDVKLAGEYLFVPGVPTAEVVANADHFREGTLPDGDVPYSVALPGALGDSVTYTTWVKWTSARNPSGILGHQSGTSSTNAHVLFIGTSGILNYRNTSSPVQNNGVSVNINSHFTDGLWHHYAMVISGGVANVYIDGAWVGSRATGTGTTTYTMFRAGLLVDGTTTYDSYSKRLETAVIREALDAEAVASIYAHGLRVPDQHLINPVKSEGVYNA